MLKSTLLIDSCPLAREGAMRILQTCLPSGHNIHTSIDLISAFRLDFQPDLVILMARSWLVETIDDLKQVQRHWPDCRLILGDCDPYSNQISREQAVAYALKIGLQGYFCRQTPVNKICDVILAVLEGNMLLQTIRPFRQELQKPGLSQAYFLLSERERVVLKLLMQNYSNSEIADTMRITRRTVESHKNSIRQKFGVKTAFPLIQPELANLLKLELVI